MPRAEVQRATKLEAILRARLELEVRGVVLYRQIVAAGFLVAHSAIDKRNRGSGFRVPVRVPGSDSKSSMARVKSAIASAHRDVPASVMARFRMASANAGVDSNGLGVVANRLVVLSVEAVHARPIGEGVRRARLERRARA